MNSSNYIDVCSATSAKAPGYLPTDLPREPGNRKWCHVNSLTSYTGVNPSSGGIYDPLVIAKLAEFETRQSFRKALKKYPELKNVVQVSGNGKYKIYAAYPGSLDVVAGGVKQEAHSRQLEPLKQYCVYINSGSN